MTTDRKKAHIEFAMQSHAGFSQADQRFYYEPMMAAHPIDNAPVAIPFMGRTLGLPLWVSSMTGGTPMAGEINKRLATVCREFGMGMGLGSCRSLLTSDTWIEHFALRSVIGPDLPLFTNLGINQLEIIARDNRWQQISTLITKLEADGIMIHVNPLQEFFQPGGDKLKRPPITTIKRLIDHFQEMKIVVKEVGQGMGPVSLRSLLELPLEGIEFGAYGGTNFSKLEAIRNGNNRVDTLLPLASVGHNALEMIDMVQQIKSQTTIATRHLILSGGVKDFLDGYYLLQKSPLPSVYGHASAFLTHAREGTDQLRQFVVAQAEGLKMAYAYLQIK